jgi:hypothetical protein
VHNKILGLLGAGLLMGSVAAHADETLDYSDGNPVFNTTLVLSASLPQTGTVDVVPASVNFSGIGLTGFTSPYGFIFEPGFVGTPLFQFTTVNGAITAFDMGLNMTEPGTNSPTNLMLTISSSGDSYFEQQTGFTCEFNSCNPMTASSAPGHWTGAPEIDPASAGGAIALLLGGVAVLKGRRRMA